MNQFLGLGVDFGFGGKESSLAKDFFRREFEGAGDGGADVGAGFACTVKKAANAGHV